MSVKFVFATVMLGLVTACTQVSAATLYNLQFGNAGDGSESVLTIAQDVDGPTAVELQASSNTDRFIFDDSGATASGLITGGAATAGSQGGGEQGTATSNIDGESFDLTISAAAGNLLDLDSFSFEAVRGTGGDNDRGIEVFAETNGDSFVLGTSTLVIDDDVIEPNRNSLSVVLLTADLTGPEFQGIESVTFRFIPVTANGTGNLDFGNITLTGDVAAVPEPSTVALVLCAAVGLVALGQRK